MAIDLIEKVKSRNKKIVVVGDAVGKTTLLRRYVEGRFSAETRMTIGVEFFTEVIVYENRPINFVYWDFAGQERWRAFQIDLCKGADGAIVCFDFTRIITVKNLNQWVKLVRRREQSLPIILLGCRSDLDTLREVYEKDLLELADQLNNIGCFFTSAKSGINVETAFETLINCVLNCGNIRYIRRPPKPRRETIPKKRDEVKPISVFMSYSRLDSKTFLIAEIAKRLTIFKEIDEIFFYEGENYENIIEYMNDNIDKCDVFLAFCSQNALKSKWINLEWQAALSGGKTIIPIFIDFEADVPIILKPNLGVQFNLNDIIKNVDEIHSVILKAIGSKTRNRMR